jgi:hypothetical protein
MLRRSFILWWSAGWRARGGIPVRRRDGCDRARVAETRCTNGDDQRKGGVSLAVPTPYPYDVGSGAGGIPPGRWSLWDMINFGLDGVMTALQFARQHGTITMVVASEGRGDQPLEDQYKSVVENNLQWVHKMCNQHVLSATGDRLARIWGMWSRPITYGALAIELKPLLEALEDDLKKLHFYRYPQHKTIEFLRIPGTWTATLNAFPLIRPEIESGVDCYALEHNAASMFHMMRVAEVGMRALARERQVSFPRHPIEWAEWENIIDQIESKAKAATATPPMSRGPARDAARTFYTGAVAQLRAFKETRNRLMHMRGSFDELDALWAIGQVRDFMNGLPAKIGEKTKTPIRRWP